MYILPIFRKKSPEDSLYPGFHKRMLTALIDMAIACIVLIPLFNIISHIIYDVSPGETFLQIWNDHIKESQNLGFTETMATIKQRSDYKNFINAGGYKALIAERVLSFIFLPIGILFFWLKKQATPGKSIFSLKIVDSKTMSKPTNSQLVVRLLSYIVSILPLGLGIFYIAMNKKRKGLHDCIAGTVVISEKHLNKIHH